MKKEIAIKHVLIIVCFMGLCKSGVGQAIARISKTVIDSINRQEIDSILTYLASDKLKGRGNFINEQLDAAHFINQRFIAYELKPFPGYKGFYQPFLTRNNTPLPDTVPVDIRNVLKDTLLFNLVAVLPGHSLPSEAIIFSAHYDHITNRTGNQLYHGADDDASGTTDVLALARYFAMRKDNARTLIFCLFAGETLGRRGAYAFEKLVDPDAIKAVINIKMIGRTNQLGRHLFFVTGSNYSDLYKILAKRSRRQKVAVRGDYGYDPTGLFTKSDNYPFAIEGIPAHSIMCSTDIDPCHYQPCDDRSHIDITNMVDIIKAIASYTATLISGEDTPQRIKL